VETAHSRGGLFTRDKGVKKKLYKVKFRKLREETGILKEKLMSLDITVCLQKRRTVRGKNRCSKADRVARGRTEVQAEGPVNASFRRGEQGLKIMICYVDKFWKIINPWLPLKGKGEVGHLRKANRTIS